MSVTFPTVELLPVIQDEPPLRADAARNRDKVLVAAEKLFAERSADCVTMDAVAAEAGVGKGTLFRALRRPRRARRSRCCRSTRRACRRRSSAGRPRSARARRRSTA